MQQQNQWTGEERRRSTQPYQGEDRRRKAGNMEKPSGTGAQRGEQQQAQPRSRDDIQ